MLSSIKVLRSKNAGPATVTLDIFFQTQQGFAQAVQNPLLGLASVAQAYGWDSHHVQRYELPDIWAMKFSMPRRHIAGALGDGDLYGAQQHAPLLRLLS